MGSRWSHSFIVCEVTPERTYIIETSDYETTYGVIEKYLNDPFCEIEIWSPKNAKTELRQKAIRECAKNVGQVYGYLQLFSLGLRRLLMRINVRIKNFIRQNYVCDQLVLSGARYYPGPLFRIDPKSIDTEEMYQAISNAPKHFERVILAE